ncbi:MAG: hypothetical protein O2914_01735 [Bacteroidetes bacterium]|nr:hypothetical protein [Bacteroidota bacterium]MDA0937535.1 hypothetical protein [Bacteroidota bacterium]
MKPRTNAYFFFILTLFALQIHAQEGDDLFASLETTETETQLLPENMLITQRLLWGNKGLLRTTGIAKLNKTQRQKELNLRRKLLVAHQVIGYATLAGMIAQGIIGGKLYNGDYSLKDTHENLGMTVNALYFAGAGLSLFAPPPLINKKVKGWSSMKAHKFLATIHLSAMIATNALSEDNKKLHRAAAYTAFGSYAAAMIVLKF